MAKTLYPKILQPNDFFQGSIFLYEYNFVIRSMPIGNMDVFSYGKADSCPYPIYHAVIDDPEFIGLRPGKIIEEEGLKLTIDTSTHLPEAVRNLLPFPLCKQVQTIHVIIVNAVHQKGPPEKGKGVTIEMASRSSYIQPTKEKTIKPMLLLS